MSGYTFSLYSQPWEWKQKPEKEQKEDNHHFWLVCHIGCNSTTAWRLWATDWSLGLPNWDLGSFKKNNFPSKSHQPTATTGALFPRSEWKTSECLMCLHSLNTLRADWDWETGGQWDTTGSNYTHLKTIRIITKEEVKLQKARNKNQPSKEQTKERQVHNSTLTPKHKTEEWTAKKKSSKLKVNLKFRNPPTITRWWNQKRSQTNNNQ